MNNAVDASLFRYNESTRIEVRRELGINDSTVLIGHVGRFNTQKNHKFLIDIFKEINKINPDSVLVLTGNGNLEDKIRNQVKELDLEGKVIFTGVRSDVNRLLQGFDVFLFPSLFEGLSVILIETQASGTPCLTSTAVSRQTEISDVIEFYPLEESAENWAKKALELSQKDKKDTFDQIASSGYDITTNAQWLESFYLENNK